MSLRIKEISIACLLSGILLAFGLDSWRQFVLIFVSIIGIWQRRSIWIIIQTLPRDLRFVLGLFHVLLWNYKLRRQNATPSSLLSAQAIANPDKPCFIFQGRTTTLCQMNDYSWRIAHVFSHRGIVRGDVVALMCTNRPEFVATWIGLSRLGAITALINTNLRYDALKHSLKVASPRAVIVSSTLCQAIREVREVLREDCQLLKLCGADQPDQETVEETDFSLLDQMIRDAPATPIDGLLPPNYADKLLYIYTSGTTGLPKAAVMLSSRYLFITVATIAMLPLKYNDRIYSPLPMYHTAGGIMGVGPAVCYGITVYLREKFSASAYFKECAENHCTVGQYIGEMCRYLLAVPPSIGDHTHTVRLMVGNGLRTAIWEKFVKRFGIKQIVELYGATEGNTNIVNVDGTVGAVGFLPKLLPQSLFPIGLVKVDDDTGELLRAGPNNLCIRCKPGEPGMFVGVIREGDSTREFHGYVDKSSTQKKVAYNVYSVGDKAFLSGDILVMDEKGYLYFKDRTGDTFRWKGENVATAEVEAAISNAVGLKDACVYGVQIPESEGRAGMATILDPNHSIDISSLGKSLAKSLPFYAQPLFIRIADKMDLTGTYKLKKTDLQKEGFDCEKIKDKIYFSSGKGVYKELTKNLYEDIITGKIRV